MLGVDILEIERIRLAVKRGHFFLNAFTRYEREYYNLNGSKLSTLAGIYSAKEAVAKALGTGLGKLRLCDIEIRHTLKGAPYAVLLNEAKKMFNVTKIDVSISHDNNFAISAAFITKKRIFKKSSKKELESITKSLLPDVPPTELTNLGKNIVLPLRKSNSHKGTYGKIKIIGGSPEMPGSCRMSCEAAYNALKNGAGLVTLCVPESIKDCYQAAAKELMLFFMPDSKGKIVYNEVVLDKIISGTDVIAFGMGMGYNEALPSIVSYIGQNFEGVFIIDADGLKALYNMELKSIACFKPQIILTPHAKEFSDLYNNFFGVKNFLDLNLQERSLAVKKMAQYMKVVIICKSDKSIISDGNAVYYNTTGTPAMAKGGSGDVLAGIITAASVRLNALDAVLYSSYIAGINGENAEKKLGSSETVLATDLINEINNED